MSMALKYGLMKKAKAGGETCGEHGKMNCMDCGGTSKDDDEAAMPSEVTGSSYAEGGMVDDDRDMELVDRIMKKRNGEPEADFDTNDFDAMDDMKVPDDADYTGANSGDEVGNEAMDENDQDLIRRIMRSRAKKDSTPRPA